MAKNKIKVSGLVNQLTNSNLAVSKSLKPTNLGGTSSGINLNTSKPPSLGGTRPLSLTAKSLLTGIQFGHSSTPKTTSTQSGSEWTSLLKQTASGGVASALTGGLSSLGGIGSLFSGIISLFGGGGKKTLPALVDFQLPTSISQTVNVSSKGSSTFAAIPVESSSSSGTIANQGNGTSLVQYQSAAIAQAVKIALLNSSSLNDVIREI